MARWKLYWVKDGSRDEDCFIIAKSRRSATAFHEQQQCLNPGAARAEFVADLPAAAERPAIERFRVWSRRRALVQADDPTLHPWPGWAYEEDLRAAGAELRSHEGACEVIMDGRSFFATTLGQIIEARLARRIP